MEIKKTIKPTEYLYNCKPQDFANMNYKEALEFKVKAGKTLLQQLVYVPFDKQDNDRIVEVVKAIKFNEGLLNEMKASI